MLVRSTPLDIPHPSYSFQLALIFLALLFAVVAIALILYYKVRSEEDAVPLDITIISGVFLTGTFIIFIMVWVQVVMKGTYWYTMQFPDHYQTN